MTIEDDTISRAQSGDEGAFVDLMRAHYGFVYAIVIGIVNNPQDAEEVVQDTLLNAYRGLPDLEDTKSSKTGWQKLREIVRSTGSENSVLIPCPSMRWGSTHYRTRTRLTTS